jgi:hypothetical protein
MSEGKLARPVNPGRHAHEILARLLALDWTGKDGFDHARSRAGLMREYLRRASWWAQVVHAIEEWPFFDIAAHLAPQVHAQEELASQLEALISTGIGWPSVVDTCQNARRWAAVLDAGVLPAFDALDQALLRKLGSRPSR